MKYIRSKDLLNRLEMLVENLHFAAQLPLDQYIIPTIQYILAKAELEDYEPFFKLIRQHLPKSVENTTMTLADQLRHEGMQQGILQGMRKGEYELFKRQLQRKFSNIEQKYYTLIEGSNADDLLNWGERLIDAKTIEDIFTDE